MNPEVCFEVASLLKVSQTLDERAEQRFFCAAGTMRLLKAFTDRNPFRLEKAGNPFSRARFRSSAPWCLDALLVPTQLQ